MTVFRTFRYSKIIITCFLSSLVVFFLPFISDAQNDEEVCAVVSSFDEFISSLDQMMRTGGTIALNADITVPASETYTYINGRYKKEVLIETGGHTIYVEGSLSFWPYLTIRGNDYQKELFHVYPGGELRLVSVCLDAGESGTAVVQEEGAFFMYGSEEGMGLPEFSCTGSIRFAERMTAAAYWRYNCEKLPILRVPYGQEFTADMLPDKVMSLVNRDHTEYEEEVPVIWDYATFPDKHERTLIQGKFADGYSQYRDYAPVCLVVWESDTYPFFLNVYLESATQKYDMVFMYGQAPQSGIVHIQASDTGEKWEDIAGTEGYTPIEVKQNESFFWLLSYNKMEPGGERPKYYRLRQILDDGTELYSEALELNGQFLFTGADIEGGRGGELSPDEGENQLTEAENADKISEENQSAISSDLGADIGLENSSDSKDLPNMDGGSTSEDSSSAVWEKENEGKVQDLDSSEEIVAIESENVPSDNTGGIEKIIGTGIVICILVGTVTFFIFVRKNHS